MESCLVCPDSISVPVIINYTNMAATSHIRLCFLSRKWTFAEFGHYHEEKISAVSPSFKKINWVMRTISKGLGW